MYFVVRFVGSARMGGAADGAARKRPGIRTDARR